MKKTARVIVTFGCNRKCPGCCNSQLPEHRTIHSDEELMKYQEIVITGGEPMLIPGKVLEFINRMWDKGYRGKMYLYTSFWNGKGISKEILKELDGFTFTLHAECTDADIIALKNLSNSGILQNKDFGSRLIIDKRVYDRYDLSNINFSRWDVIRKLEWKEKCSPASNEDLLVYEL
ncbi:MAG: hypothetical protein ACLSUP_02660 [Blautia massiliensis (ex Durand et al. 2017)]|uniref:hypothetical protein n=1 Tax=Blautia massiliensis (ex Durand et al. 2017) TaxID=1737424 RepID=UPI0039945552